MKKFILLLIVVALAGGFWMWRRSHAPEKAPAYRAVPVQRGDIRVTILATGTVQPQNRVELNSPVPGRIEKILVEEGDYVKQGQVLAWISSSERATLLDAARARGESELKRWEELYKPTPLVAPLDGQIIASKLDPGQSVAESSAILVMSDQLIVQAQVDETDIARVSLNQRAEIQLDAYPDQVIPARVEHIAYEADTVNNVTIYNVDVLPERVPDFIRSGMSAGVTFIVAETNDVLLVPLEAVQGTDGKSQVLVPSRREGEEPRAVRVRLGEEDGRNAEVLEGLHEGDKVLVSDVRLFNDNSERKGTPLVPFGRGRRH